MASEQQKRMMKASTISSATPAVCQRRTLDRTDRRLVANPVSIVDVVHPDQRTEEVLGGRFRHETRPLPWHAAAVPPLPRSAVERIGHKLRGTVRGHGERRGHALLRRHEFHAGLQPAAQRLDWRVSASNCLASSTRCSASCR